MEHLNLCTCPECAPHMLEDAWKSLQAVPSYTERYADGREQFPETDISCQPLMVQVGNLLMSYE